METFGEFDTNSQGLNTTLNSQFLQQRKLDEDQILKQEKNVLLVLNELNNKMQPFSLRKDPDVEIDLLMIADSLKESGMSVK